ncbi:MAG TPA: TerC family protein, partial [Pseudomonadaceae bacterium]|nr:TerC family protein [Pseudomonadaceae bacterium]
RARKLGIGFALVTRIGLLFSLSWIIQLTDPLFVVFSEEISGRDLVLLVGGLFLLAKATHEIHALVEHDPDITPKQAVTSSMASIIIQIGILDIVFSLDSVITAVGLVDELSIMVIAVMVAVVVMLFSARTIGDFIDNHPTLKVLALSFLMMIGFMLVVESFDVHVPKGYIYFAMAFSVIVEIINIRVRKRFRNA